MSRLRLAQALAAAAVLAAPCLAAASAHAAPAPATPTPSPTQNALNFRADNVTTNAAYLCFSTTGRSEDQYYAVFEGSIKRGWASAATLREWGPDRGCLSASGLRPGTSYTLDLRTSPDDVTYGPVLSTVRITTLGDALPSSPLPTPTRVTPSPTPTPGNTIVRYSYSLAGSAVLKTLTKGSLPLTGGINADFVLQTGAFTADLTLNPTKGQLKAGGFLPVDATVVLQPTEKVVGTLKAGKLTATAKVRIKIPSAKSGGIELAGGAKCQAKQVSSVPLASTQETFRPLAGGPLAGSFSISELQDCGALTGILSPLVAGYGNTIALNLTPTSIPLS